MPIRPDNYRTRPYSGPLGGQTSPGAGYANIYPGAQQPPQQGFPPSSTPVWPWSNPQQPQQPPQQGNVVPQAQNAPPAVPANQPGSVPQPKPQQGPKYTWGNSGSFVTTPDGRKIPMPASQPVGVVPPPNLQPPPQGNAVPQVQNAPPAVPANQPGFVPPPPQQGFPPPFTPAWPWSNPQQPQQPLPQGNAVPQAPDMPDWPPDSQLAFPATPGLGQAKWNDPATWDPSKGLPNVGDLYGGMQFDGTSWQPLPISYTPSPQWNSSMPDLPSPKTAPPWEPSGYSAPHSRVDNPNQARTLPPNLSNWQNRMP